MFITGAKLTVASAAVTWKYTTLEGPPPGPGFTTVTPAVPAVATFAAGTMATRCSPSMNVVASGAALKLTVEPGRKPVPLTLSGSAVLPGETAVGTSGWFKNGTGFPGGANELIWILKEPLIAVAPVASVTVASKYQVPPPVGVPLMVPLLGLSVSPSGTAPPTLNPVIIGPS